ncbi:type IV secretion system DNA-binding domain-containing protein [Castellaniella sp.]|uniref:type IV secretion system DNA-binding domain-containing protein n=1 Tax=Castellaniella sp. TaxID=1955812 RepID=UPI003C770E8D
MAWQDWNGRTAWYFVKLTPGGSRTDPQTAHDISESLGKHEVERPKFSVSRSVDHRNTSDNMDRATEEVVTAAQIQALPVLEGYVALAGDLPVARVKMPYRRFEGRTESFLEAWSEAAIRHHSVLRLTITSP